MTASPVSGGPAETLLQGVEWQPTGITGGSDELYATHTGRLDVLGHSFRCFRLSDGRAVFHTDDVHDFLAMLAAREGATHEG